MEETIVSYEVYVRGQKVEGDLENIVKCGDAHTLQDLVNGIRERWGTYSSIMLKLWEKDYSR